MKKILIVGSEGYLGSALKKYLLKKKNIKVSGIDNKLYGNVSYSQDKTTYKKIDIRDVSSEYIEKFDVIICLAAMSNNPVNKKDKKKFYDITTKYTKELADKCMKLDKKFIFPSSCSVYGYLKDKIANEKTEPKPLTYYSKNKIEIEKILKKMSKKNKKFNPIILRIATVFGFSPSMRFDLVINMFMGMVVTEKKIVLNSNGLAIRPFIEINDLCEIFYRLINFKNTKFEIFNAGNNYYNFSILEIAKKVCKLTGATISLKKKDNQKLIHQDELIKNQKDKRSYRVNFNKIKKNLKLIFRNDLEKKIKKNLNIFTKKKLTKVKLNSKNFYRLNKIQHLIKMKRVDKNLRSIG